MPLLSDPEALAAYVGFAVAAASLFVGIWRVSWGTKAQLDTLEKRIVECIEEQSDKDKKILGETISAVRVHADLAHVKVSEVNSKVFQVELYGRDHYAKREDLVEAVNRFDRKLDAISAKLDGIIEKRIG